jgi:hypothetical protein
VCAKIYILLSLQLKNRAGKLSMEIDADKKLKLCLLEKKDQLEAVKYISDITLATQTNWHSEPCTVRGTDSRRGDNDQHFAEKQ